MSKKKCMNEIIGENGLKGKNERNELLLLFSLDTEGNESYLVLRNTCTLF